MLIVRWVFNSITLNTDFWGGVQPIPLQIDSTFNCKNLISALRQANKQIITSIQKRCDSWCCRHFLEWVMRWESSWWIPHFIINVFAPYTHTKKTFNVSLVTNAKINASIRWRTGCWQSFFPSSSRFPKLTLIVMKNESKAARNRHSYFI